MKEKKKTVSLIFIAGSILGEFPGTGRVGRTKNEKILLKKKRCVEKRERMSTGEKYLDTFATAVAAKST